jgi:hypothetical protein
VLERAKEVLFRDRKWRPRRRRRGLGESGRAYNVFGQVFPWCFPDALRLESAVGQTNESHVFVIVFVVQAGGLEPPTSGSTDRARHWARHRQCERRTIGEQTSLSMCRTCDMDSPVHNDTRCQSIDFNSTYWNALRKANWKN